MNIRERLESLAEPDFQKFESKLIPNLSEDKVLGVRLPKLRELAKKIAKADWKRYLDTMEEVYFEEIMLKGMIIGYADMSLEERIRQVKKFVPKIDNWSVCDSFCSGLKVARKYPQEIWELLLECIHSGNAYEVRFGVVMLLNYYTDKRYVEAGLRLLDAIRHEDYYVKMAVAWAISVYYVKCPEETTEYLKKNHLDLFTYNKALQKIIESRKVSQEEKKIIRGMKRKE